MDTIFYFLESWKSISQYSTRDSFKKRFADTVYQHFQAINSEEQVLDTFEQFEFENNQYFQTNRFNNSLTEPAASWFDFTKFPTISKPFVYIWAFEFGGRKEFFWSTSHNDSLVFISMNKNYNLAYHVVRNRDAHWWDGFNKITGYNDNPKMIASIILDLCKITKLLIIAKSQVGIEEVKVNKQKYGEWYYEMYINAHNITIPASTKYKWIKNDQWCGQFVSWCFCKAGVSLDSQESFGFMYCPAGLNKLIEKDNSITSIPAAGDLVFYDWDDDGTVQHVGIITEYNSDGSFFTIEGNTSEGSKDASGGKVMLKLRHKNSQTTFVHPKILD